ncbi:MAG TPA: zonular occludens toxin domain-containing protein [Bacteroidales bacterium]|nr:zonular occludens toxin domain-containing protein [Bacteroidales bacterium]
MADFILVTGRPGNGKTIYVVAKMLEKKTQEEFYFFHNIDGLQEHAVKNGLIDGNFCKNWETFCDEQGIDVLQFFSKDYQVELANEIKEKYGKKMFVVIDEMHDYFLKYERSVLSWITYYRHLDQTIYGMTQRKTQVHYMYRNSLKVERLAKVTICGITLYHDIYDGSTMGWQVFKRRQIYFDAYKSAMAHTKRKFPWYFVVIGVAVFFAFMFFISTGSRFKKSNGVKELDKSERKLLSMSSEAIASQITENTGNSVSKSSQGEQKNRKKVNYVNDLSYDGYVKYVGGELHFLSDLDGNNYRFSELYPFSKVIAYTVKRLVAENQDTGEIDIFIHRSTIRKSETVAGTEGRGERPRF